MAQQVNAELTHLVEIRYNSAVTADDRILFKYNGQTIEGVSLPSGSEVSVTITGHGFTTGDEVTFVGLGGAVELNAKTYEITVTDADTFTLDGTDGDDFTAWTSGGTAGTARIFDINVVKNLDERNIRLELLCTESL